MDDRDKKGLCRSQYSDDLQHAEESVSIFVPTLMP